MNCNMLLLLLHFVETALTDCNSAWVLQCYPNGEHRLAIAREGFLDQKRIPVATRLVVLVLLVGATLFKKPKAPWI